MAKTLDLDAAVERRRIKRLIETWLTSGALVKRSVVDGERHARPCVQVGEWAK